LDEIESSAKKGVQIFRDIRGLEENDPDQLWDTNHGSQMIEDLLRVKNR